jgi:hypothetical protein
VPTDPGRVLARARRGVQQLRRTMAALGVTNRTRARLCRLTGCRAVPLVWIHVASALPVVAEPGLVLWGLAHSCPGPGAFGAGR